MMLEHSSLVKPKNNNSPIMTKITTVGKQLIYKKQILEIDGGIKKTKVGLIMYSNIISSDVC